MRVICALLFLAVLASPSFARAADSCYQETCPTATGGKECWCHRNPAFALGGKCFYSELECEDSLANVQAAQSTAKKDRLAAAKKKAAAAHKK